MVSQPRFAVAPVQSWKIFRFQFTNVTKLRTYKKDWHDIFFNIAPCCVNNY